MSRKTLLFVAVAFVVALATWRFGRSRPAETNLSYSAFLKKVEKTPGIFKPNTLQVRLGLAGEAMISGQFRDDARFVTTGIVNDSIMAKLGHSDIGFEIVRETDQGWEALALACLPVIVVGALFLYLTRQGRARNGQILSFGKITPRGASPQRRKVTFLDVAGIDEAKEEVEEIIAFLKAPTKFTRLGGRVPRGVLLMGAPGTGKTLLARAIAGEAGVPFFSLSASEFVEMFVGVGASRVRDLFQQAKTSAPCIVFIDEIDAVGRQRGTGYGGGHDEREQTLNQLLVEMDGFAPNDGVILIAATNRPDVLDPALLRPGRFDRRIVVPRPDIRGRQRILDLHTRKTPLAKDVALEVIARGTSGMVGADLENLVNEAALIAARGDKTSLEMHDFEMARDKVLMGPERRSMVISDTDKRFAAYHEAGHTLVGKMMKGTDPVHKATIIPRDRGVGVTLQIPGEDRLGLSKESANDQIALTMGGRAAEEIIFGHVTTGATDDIQTATDMARQMVCHWGMSEAIGPLSLGRSDQMVFLGRDISDRRDYSAGTAATIDNEIRRIVTDNYDRARRVVLANRDKLTALAEALLERETIDAGQIDRLLALGGVASS